MVRVLEWRGKDCLGVKQQEKVCINGSVYLICSEYRLHWNSFQAKFYSTDLLLALETQLQNCKTEGRRQWAIKNGPSRMQTRVSRKDGIIRSTEECHASDRSIAS